MLADPNRDVGELWMEMTQYSHVNGENHPVIGSAGRDMMDRPEEEAGSVLSTAKSYLSLYRDPVVARNVSKSQWRIKDLMNHDSPVSHRYPAKRQGSVAATGARPGQHDCSLACRQMEFERVKAEAGLASLPRSTGIQTAGPFLRPFQEELQTSPAWHD
jgi:hypothetical protein